MEIFGQIRINDYERASDSKWREGTLVFDKTEKYWQCKVHFKANKNPSSVRQYKVKHCMMLLEKVQAFFYLFFSWEFSRRLSEVVSYMSKNY